MNHGKFRSKQVVIEAIQYTGALGMGDHEVKALMHFTSLNDDPADRGRTYVRATDHPASLLPELRVYDKLHDSWITVKPGQWIIRGTKGEYYPCDDEVLQQKYENVTSVDLSVMDFGAALKAAKDGERIARQNWNGKGQWVYYVPPAEYPAMTNAAKKFYGKTEKVPYTAYMAIKTTDDVVAPWLASQTDMLADDWFVVK